MSIAEINDLMESYERAEKHKRKERIVDLYCQTSQIVEGFIKAFNGGKLKLQPWDYYPELFEEEKKDFEKMKEESELIEYKKARRRFAHEHNKKFKGDDRQ